MDAGEKLHDKDKKFIIEKASQGFEPAELQYLLEEELDREITPTKETISEYLNSSEAQEELRVRENVREKKADIEKEELIEELVDIKEKLKSRIDHLHEEDLDAISSDQVDNLLKTVDRIGEYIGELERAGTNANVVKVDKSKTFIQQNITKVVQHLPKEEKKELAEKLEEDSEVEGFIIQRKETPSEG